MEIEATTISCATERRADLAYQPLPAVLLAAPGLLCWAILAAAFLNALSDSIFDSIAIFGLVLTIVAVPCALFSLFHYLKPRGLRRRWYVVLNLVINVSGLLFISMVLTRVIH